MSGPRRDVPYSSYSSLANAVPNAYPQSSSSTRHNNAAMQQGQMYAPAAYQHAQPSYNMSAPPPSSYAPQNYPGFSNPAAQYPSTPYTSQYAHAPPQNMGYPAAHPQAYAGGSAMASGMYTAPYAPQQQQPPPATYPAQAADAPKQCYNCGRTSTPLWRRDPKTGNFLCNACGLYLQQRHSSRPQVLIDADNDEDESSSGASEGGPECSHCHTHQTSVWRRNKDGEQVCNACGVYQRLRGKPRPLELRGKKIRPRAKHSSSHA